MPYYSPERKAATLKMLLPPLNLTMAEASRREGVSEMSLSTWPKQVRSEGNAVPEPPIGPELDGQTQFAVVLETAGLSEIELAEYCRRKGLYPEQIKAWRQACINGQKTDKPSKRRRGMTHPHGLQISSRT